MAPLIRLAGIDKIYRAGAVETRALSGVDMEIEAGEYVAVAGPSGCGKSTLLSLLGLLDAPSQGVYLLDGQPTAQLSARERARVRNRQIGFIFQSFNLIGDLAVRDNVALPLRYRGMGSRRRRQSAEQALERVAMAAYADHFPAQLSGGQQQRVAVARAIVGRPRILLADEPTGNLDSENGNAVMELIGELHAEGAAVVMVTHDPRCAGLASREVDLLDGRVLRDAVAAHSAVQPMDAGPLP